MESRGAIETFLPHAFNQRLSLRDESKLEEKLKTLLLENPFTLDNENEGGNLYKWDDLKTMLPNATDEDLKSALSLLSALEINGYWRIIDDTYIEQMLFSIVWHSFFNNWSLTSLNGNNLVKALMDKEYSPVIARRCLELYASTTDGRVWELDTKRVAVQSARGILSRRVGRKMQLQQFMCQWACAAMPMSFDVLQGEVVVEQDGNQYWVCLPQDRF